MHNPTETLEPVLPWPLDAVEVGYVAGAHGLRGQLHIQPHSAAPEALFSSKRWYLRASSKTHSAVTPRPAAAISAAGKATHAVTTQVDVKVLLQKGLLAKVQSVKEHGKTVVASLQGVADRTAAEALKGAAVYVLRSSFPSPEAGEYYWVDLLGLEVVNRQGERLGVVLDLLATGPQTTLVVGEQAQLQGSSQISTQVRGQPQPQPENPAKSPLNANAKASAATQHLIPFVDAYVDNVDLAARRITVDWLPEYSV